MDRQKDKGMERWIGRWVDGAGDDSGKANIISKNQQVEEIYQLGENSLNGKAGSARIMFKYKFQVICSGVRSESAFLTAQWILRIRWHILRF